MPFLDASPCLCCVAEAALLIRLPPLGQEWALPGSASRAWVQLESVGDDNFGACCLLQTLLLENVELRRKEVSPTVREGAGSG